MAKNDDARTRDLLKSENTAQTGRIQDYRTNVVDPQRSMFQNNYQNAVTQQGQDYNRLQGGYSDFAKTGGFSQGDLANLRARAVSPTRAIYSNARNEVNRASALNGGYAPGKGTLMARMAREQSQGISDQNTNINAAIAQMVQQGKLAGLQGGSGLYGATPGQANMFGNEVLQNAGQGINLLGADQNRMNTALDTQLGLTKAPGKFESAMGNVSSFIKPIQQIHSLFES